MYEFSFRRSLVAIFKSPDPQVRSVSHQIWRKHLPSIPEISCSQSWDRCEEPKQNECNFQGTCERTRTRQTILWSSRSRQRHRTSLQNLSTSWRNRIKWTSREKKRQSHYDTKWNEDLLTTIRSAAPPIVLVQSDLSPYLQPGHKEGKVSFYCTAAVWHDCWQHQSGQTYNGWDKRQEGITAGESDPLQWEMADQSERSHQAQIHPNVIQDGGSGIRSTALNAHLYYIHKGIHSPSDDYSGTPDCLFGSKHKWYALIPHSFIVELAIVSTNAGEMGPITVSDGSLWLHCRARRWRSQTGRNKSNQRPLVHFCKFEKQNGKTFLAVSGDGSLRTSD